MKPFLYALLLILFAFPSLEHDSWARTTRKSTVITVNTEKVLNQLIDVPLEKKQQEVKQKLASLDVLTRGFSPEKSSSTIPASRLIRYKEELYQLQGEYIGEIESMLGGLYAQLNDLKMKFQQETARLSPRDTKLKLDILSQQINREMQQFDKNVLATDLVFDERRDEIINEAQRKHRVRRRR